MARGDPRDSRWVEAPIFGPKPPRTAALMPEPPGGWTNPAQAEAVRQAGRYLEAAGYAVEEVTPPDVEAVIGIWHTLGSTDLFRSLRPRIDSLGDQASRASVAHWLELYPPSDLDGVLDALALRDLLLRRWQTFFTRHSVLVLPTMADLPPPQDEDLTLEGQRRVLESLRASLIAPALGLCGLQIPVGRRGVLRPGIQIMAARFREDLCLDAGEVIEAAQAPIRPVDPVP
jgi:amidase